ncbi:E3 ubiquitin/ISG15 ligase TRIM25 [Xenopus laevis]|uniref:Uncharacterized protein n=2 Tax=Xenopus laevis TaxID=8355 RepID=A0A974BYL3_XENLA|nr:E3 ubiquitin/ISG15 ligase TRIM25 [Xenopus laevis]OCT63117.1 hypothetical protein XELAEV_18044213mg [Xenopus laevis]
MELAAVREELTCSICQEAYKDPVTLVCAHNFCLHCISRTWDSQWEREAECSCPECRQTFYRRPELKKNLTLCKIVKAVMGNQPEPKDTGMFCTYCLHASVTASKTCLLCEAYLCPNHLRVHCKSGEHVLSELSSSSCVVHKKLLNYYCFDDKICICESCCCERQHKDHYQKHVRVASKNRKNELQKFLEKLIFKNKAIEKKLQRLLDQRYKEEPGRGIWNRKPPFPAFEHIYSLKTKRGQLISKIHHIKLLCNTENPLTVLQGWEPDNVDYCEVESDQENDLALKDLLVTAVIGLHRRRIFLTEDSNDTILDINTAGNYMTLSDDLRAASWSKTNKYRPETPARFWCAQVLSSRSFSSGRHYWKIETSNPGNWMVGMAYTSIKRKGDESRMGYNDKSWVLTRGDKGYSIIHNAREVILPHTFSNEEIGIYLEFEGGRLSFFELSDPIRHLYTFTATFTEPLHIILSVHSGWVRL